MDAASLFGGPTSSPHRTPVLSSAFTTSDENEPPSAASLFGGVPDDSFALPQSSISQLRRSTPPRVQEMPDDLFGGEGNGGGRGDSFYGASSARQDALVAPSRSGFGGAPPPTDGVIPPPPPVEPMTVELCGADREDGTSPATDFGFGASRSESGNGRSDNSRGVLPSPHAGSSGSGMSRYSGTHVFKGTYSGRPHPTAGFGGDVGRKPASPPPKSRASEACDASSRDCFGGPAPDSLGSTVYGTKRTHQHPSDFEREDGLLEFSPRSSTTVQITGQSSATSRSPPFRASLKETQGNGDRWKSSFDSGNLAMPPSSSGDSYASPPAGDVGAPPANLFATLPSDTFDSPPPTSTNFESGSPPPRELFESQLPPPPAIGDFGAPPTDLFGCPPASAPDATNSAVHPGSPPPSAWASPPPSIFSGAPRFEAFGVLPPPPDERERFNSSSAWDLQRANAIDSTPREGEENVQLTEAVRHCDPSVAASSKVSCSPPPPPPPPPPPRPLSGPDLGSPPASAFGEAPLESFVGHSGSALDLDVPSGAYFDDNGRVSAGSNAGRWAGDEGASAADREQASSAVDFFGFPRLRNHVLSSAGVGRVPEVESRREARQSDPRTFAGGDETFAVVDSRSQSAFRPPPPMAQELRGGFESPLPAAFGTTSNNVFGGGGSDESSAPWWQTDTGGKEQADTAAEDPKSAPHFSNVDETSNASAFPADGAGFGEIHQDESKEIPSSAPFISNMERNPNASSFPADGAGFGEIHQDESAQMPSSELFEDPRPPANELIGGRPSAAKEEWQQRPVVAKQPLPPPPIVRGASQASRSRNSNPHSKRSYLADSATSRREAAASLGVKGVASTSTMLSVAGKTLDAQNAIAVSPGWEGKPPPQLGLGVFGADTGDELGAQASNLFEAPGAAGLEKGKNDGGHSSWDLWSTDDAPATKNLITGKETLMAPPSVPEDFASPPNSPPRVFASRSESWRVSRDSAIDSTPGIAIVGIFAKRTISTASLKSSSRQLGHGSNDGKGVVSGNERLELTAKPIADEPAKDEPADGAQRKWSYLAPSGASGVSSMALFHRASYRNEERDEGTEGLSTVAELGRRVEPESTRSTPFGAWSNGSGLNAAETESYLPGESAVLGAPPPPLHGLFPTAAEADTATALDSSFPRPKVVVATLNEAMETSRAGDSRKQHTELTGAPKPRDLGQETSATPEVSHVLEASPADERAPLTVENESSSNGQNWSVLAGNIQVGRGKEVAMEAPPAAVKIADEPVVRLSEEAVAEGTVSKPFALPGLPGANSMTEDDEMKRQADIVTALDDGDGWGEGDWGDEDDDDGTHADAAAGVVAGGGSQGHESSPFQEKKKGSAGLSGKHEENNLFSSGDEGGDARSINSRGLTGEIDGDDGDVSDSEEKEETDRSSDGVDREKDLSTAETTASDFFAPPASSNANAESPRPISRNSSQGSLSSISPLSGSGSGSRRVKKDGLGASEGHRRHTLSPFLLADGPPVFLLSGINCVRARRASAGGLPPPVPSAVAATGPASERTPRATWRSLSPSRLVDKDRLIFSPLLQDRRGGSRGNSPRGKITSFSASSLGVNLDYVSPRVARLSYLPPRAGLSKPNTPGRVPNERDRQLSDERVGETRTEALGLAYRGKLWDSGQSGRSLPNGNGVKSAGANGIGAPPLTSSSPPGAKSGEFPEKGFGRTVDISGGPPQSGATTSLTHPASIGNQANNEQVLGLENGSSEPRERHGFPASRLEMQTGQRSVPSLSSDVDVLSSHSNASPNDPRRNENALQLEAATTAEASNAARHISTPASPNEAVESLDMSWATGGATNFENTVGEVHREREDTSTNGIAQATTPPAISADVFGTSSGDFGLIAQPSPFVNTSSPLTGRPGGQEPSMFGPDSGEGEHDDLGAGNTGVNGAADLFADNAPAGTADALFTDLAPDKQGRTTGGQSFGKTGDVSGNTTAFVDPFSEGPPPQEPPPPPSSLPNPWGSSPQKQPLTGPKSWPAKGGRGFDRPLTPASSAETVPLVESSSGEAGSTPAAFLGPAAKDEMSYSCEHGLGGSKVRPQGSDQGKRTDANGGNVSHQFLPASFMHSKASAGKIATRRVTPWANRSFGASSTPAPTRYPSTAGVLRGQNDGERSTGAWCRGSSSAYSAVSEDKAPRDPRLKPAGVIAVFGFGGRLVTMHPRRKMRLASSLTVNLPGGEQPANSSPCRNGPVKVWALKDLMEPQSVVHDVDTFPGPAATTPAKKLKEYVEARAAGEGETENEESGKRLLWTVASLALKFKGRLMSEKGASDPASPEAVLVQFLKECHARLKDRAASKGNRAVDASRAFPSAATPGVSRASSKEQFFRPGGAGFPETVPGTASGTDNPFLGPFPGASRPGGTGVRGGVAAPIPMGMGVFGGAPAGFGVGVGRAYDHRSAGGKFEGSEATMGSHEEVEALLVDGKKEEAVDASIRAGLWGLALLIAAQCPTPTTDSKEPGDAPQPPYQRVVRLYANAFLKSGTPLYTMALAFSGQAGAAIKYGGKSLMPAEKQNGRGVPSVGVGAGGFDGFEETWMATAAAIISNKPAGCADQLIALGDRLLDSGKVLAAHALFLVTGMQIELPTTKGARLVLPGVDHRKPAHRALRTRESIEAVHILEVLEVAGKDVHGQNSAAQGHKLRLAMKLADLGLLEKAAQYIQSTQEEVAAIGGRSQGGLEQRSPYSPQFITALNEFEDRVCGALGVSSTKPGAGGSAKKERTAGSAAAGAGGWLLNRVTSLVKTSATPGPAPTHQKPTPHASTPNGNGIPPQQTQRGGPQAGSAWGQNLQQHNNAPPFRRPGQPPLPTPFQPLTSNERKSEGRREGNGCVSSSFGPPPLPPGVSRATGPTSSIMQQGTDGGWLSSGGDLDRACSAPAMPHGMNTNTQGTCDPSGDNGFGMQGGVQGQQSMEGGVFDVNTRPDMDGYPGLERSSVSRAQSPIDHDSPGVGAATVARRLLTGSKGGVPHVRSEPVLSSRLGEGAGEPMKPQSGGWSPESAGGHDAGKAKKVVEQAPKSEPKNKATDKDEKRRRVSASGAAAAAAAAVTAKPGRFTKMMAKLFYPDAKHADVGNEMEAYYDKKAQRWVFPGETAEEAAATAPSAPPTISQLASPPGSQTGGSSLPPSIPGLDANDPLAALMAPPKVSVGRPLRHASPSGGVGGGAPLSGSGGPPLSGGLQSDGSGWAKGVSPLSRGVGGAIGSPFPTGRNFTVFAPKLPAAGPATGGSSASSAEPAAAADGGD